MLNSLRKHLKRIVNDTSGNAMLLMAAGMPALIGGAGLAVDTAQWYLWQKELQHRADQGALAGAWSLASGSTGTDYQIRALQEIESNQQIVNFDSKATVTLADYAGGRNNAVAVTISATKYLPFSGFVTGSAATVGASAQATFIEGGTYTACLVALDEDDDGAVTIGGNSIVTAKCGIMTMSKSDNSIIVPGNPEIDPGWVISAGGIDDWFNANTNAEIKEYVEGLRDPFKDLSPPNNSTPRVYECTGGKPVYTVAETVVTTVEEKTYEDNLKSPKTLIKTVVRTTTTPVTTTISVDKNFKTDPIVETTTVTGAVISTTPTKGKTVYTRTDTITTTTKTYTNKVENLTLLAANQQPGTYSSFDTACDTNMAPGIYVIDGGIFRINAQHRVIGNGVMIVLKNGAGISINGGAQVELTGMSAEQLRNAGLPSEDAEKLAGMLVFEDRNSTGNKATGANANRINGNAATLLEGKVYLSTSPLIFEGTAKVRSQCLMLVANTITIMGNANMSTFCPSGLNNEDIVAVTQGTVRLIA